MSIEAMKQALDELKYVLECINQNRVPLDGDDYHETMRMLEQAIEQAEKDQAEFKELVAEVLELEKEACEIIRSDRELKDWEAIAADQAAAIAMMKLDCVKLSADGESVFIEGVGDVPLQKEWVGLTDEEMQSIVDRHTHHDPDGDQYVKTLAMVRDADKTLMEKNYGTMGKMESN